MKNFKRTSGNLFRNTMRVIVCCALLILLICGFIVDWRVPTAILSMFLVGAILGWWIMDEMML
jgi:hypothetical protein